MAEKRLLLDPSTSESEEPEVHMTRRAGGVLHAIQHRPLPVSRKSVLGLLVSFTFCYFLIGRTGWVNVLDLDVLHSDNYVTVQHQSTVMDGESTDGMTI